MQRQVMTMINMLLLNAMIFGSNIIAPSSELELELDPGVISELELSDLAEIPSEEDQVLLLEYEASNVSCNYDSNDITPSYE